GEGPGAARMINVADYLAAAADRVDPSVWCYFEGGSGDEVTLRANVAAYGRWIFRPRMLVDVAEISLATTLLGTPVSLPLGVAPFAMQGLLLPKGECATARAATAAGALMCVSTLTTSTHAEIADASAGPRWLQLYVLRDRGRTVDHIAEAREAGYSAVVVTVDLPYLGRRERDLRLGFANPPPAPSGSRTTAAGSSTASPPGSTPCPRWPTPSAAAARSTSTAVSAAAATSRRRSHSAHAPRSRRARSRPGSPSTASRA